MGINHNSVIHTNLKHGFWRGAAAQEIKCYIMVGAAGAHMIVVQGPALSD